MRTTVPRPLPPRRRGPAPAASADDRLRRLDQLKKDGLITPEEYEAKRKAILDDL